jgi:peptidoglycan-N-acetylglucosamine deacetylase
VTQIGGPPRRDRAASLLLGLSCAAVILMVLCLALGVSHGSAGSPSTVSSSLAADGRATYVGGHATAVLTFDDGPDPVWTPRLLRILQAADAKAVFFLIGEQAAKQPELVRQIAAQGHVIGNHTYTHTDPLRLTARELAMEIDRTNEVITKITGVRPTLFRPPFGHATDALEDLMAQRSMRTVLWDNSPSDYEQPSAAHMARGVLETARPGPGTIVLLHDGDAAGSANSDRAQTCQALTPIITGLRQQGFTISPLVPEP